MLRGLNNKNARLGPLEDSVLAEVISIHFVVVSAAGICKLSLIAGCLEGVSRLYLYVMTLLGRRYYLGALWGGGAKGYRGTWFDCTLNVL